MPARGHRRPQPVTGRAQPRGTSHPSARSAAFVPHGTGPGPTADSALRREGNRVLLGAGASLRTSTRSTTASVMRSSAGSTVSRETVPSSRDMTSSRSATRQPFSSRPPTNGCAHSDSALIHTSRSRSSHETVTVKPSCSRGAMAPVRHSHMRAGRCSRRSLRHGRPQPRAKVDAMPRPRNSVSVQSLLISDGSLAGEVSTKQPTAASPRRATSTTSTANTDERHDAGISPRLTRWTSWSTLSLRGAPRSGNAATSQSHTGAAQVERLGSARKAISAMSSVASPAGGSRSESRAARGRAGLFRAAARCRSWSMRSAMSAPCFSTSPSV